MVTMEKIKQQLNRVKRKPKSVVVLKNQEVPVKVKQLILATSLTTEDINKGVINKNFPLVKGQLSLTTILNSYNPISYMGQSGDGRCIGGTQYNPVQYPLAFSKTNSNFDKRPVYLGFEYESYTHYASGSFYTDKDTPNPWNLGLRDENSPILPYLNLGNGGSPYEIRSVPATADFHKAYLDEHFFSNKVVGKLKYDVGCGLHIHISRSAFSPSSAEKFLWFFGFKENESFLKAISRGRFPSTSWCRNLAIKGDLDTLKSRLVKDKTTIQLVEKRTLNITGLEIGSKYSAVNPHRGGTYEVRIFNSFNGNDKEYLYTCLEFCDALTRFCRIYGFMSMNMEKFTSYVERRHESYPNLLTSINNWKKNGKI